MSPCRRRRARAPSRAADASWSSTAVSAAPYHEKTGIAGYTLVYSSRTMSLRTHQPFESAEKAVNENLDILSQKNILETENHRILVEETDEGETCGRRSTTSNSWSGPISWAGSRRPAATTVCGKQRQM